MPEETERFVRIPAKGMTDHTKKHPDHKIVTKTLSKREGISALYCVTCQKIATYMFEKAKNWTMAKAKAWMKRHKAFSLVEIGEAGPVFRRITEAGTEEVGIPALAEEMQEQETPPEKVAAENRTIFMFSGIEDGLAELMCRRLLALDKLSDTEPITIIISSFGGSVYASFAITDMMEYIKAPIVTIGIGKIMSAGLMIFMAGDERLVSQNVSILAHRFSAGVGGTQAELKARQREFDIIHDQMIAHFIKHTNLDTKEEVEDKLLRETDTYLTPEEVMQYGIADRFFDKAGEEEPTTTSISPPLITPSAEDTAEDSSEERQGPSPDTEEAPEHIEESGELREAIGGSRSLPLNKSPTWDGSAAEGRIRRWAGGPKKEDVKWAQYRNAFVYYDPKQKEAFAGYKLPFADVTGGKLTAVRGGVHAAMNAVLGGRGGVSIPDKRAAYNFLAGYYRKFGEKPPKYHTSQNMYGFYGYGQYGYISAPFQRALILLKRMIAVGPNEKLTRAYKLLDPTRHRTTAFKAIDSTMTAVATLRTMKGTKEIIDLIKTTRGEIISRTPRIQEGKPMTDVTWETLVDKVDWVESDRKKPFRFSGVALKVDTLSTNGRFYPASVVSKAVQEAQGNGGLTICDGHPDDEDTSPMSIVGKVIEIELNDRGEVTFEGEIVDTRLGTDVQKLLRFLPAGTQPLSLRAGGSTVYETVGGNRRERVLEMHFRGFDLVRHGGVEGAAVRHVLESGGE